MTAEESAIQIHDVAPSTDEFLSDVLEGLARPQKHISSKYFYDKRGSELFDQITELDEYYPTQTEVSILRDRADEIAESVGPRAVVIEPGAGSVLKIRTLLDDLIEPRAFMPIDIAGDHLAGAVEALAPDYPSVEMIPVAADFTAALDLPDIDAEDRATTGHRLVFFPGSTIGNLDRAEQEQILVRLADLAGENGLVLIGIDLRKDVEILHAAYDDSEGITAQFNLHLLERLRDELGADVDPSRFAHEIRYNQQHHRIEMHLRSLEDQMITIGESSFGLSEGETILTEYSHKFSIDGFSALALESGLRKVRSWTDDKNWFALVLFHPA